MYFGLESRHGAIEPTRRNIISCARFFLNAFNLAVNRDIKGETTGMLIGCELVIWEFDAMITSGFWNWRFRASG